MSIDNGPVSGPPETTETRHWREECEKARAMVVMLDRSSDAVHADRDSLRAECERLRAEVAKLERYRNAVDEALNSGDGSYKP